MRTDRRSPGNRAPRFTKTRSAAAASPRPKFTSKAFLLMFVLLVLVLSYASSLRAYQTQQERIAALQSSVSKAKGRIADLTAEEKRWQDNAFVEQQARERFGWVFPGEIGLTTLAKNGGVLPSGRKDSLSTPVRVAEGTWWQKLSDSMVKADQPEAIVTPVTRIKSK